METSVYILPAIADGYTIRSHGRNKFYTNNYRELVGLAELNVPVIPCTPILQTNSKQKTHEIFTVALSKNVG